jgi:hypothetical protein
MSQQHTFAILESRVNLGDSDMLFCPSGTDFSTNNYNPNLLSCIKKSQPQWVIDEVNFDNDDYLIMYVILDVMQSYTLCNFICYIVLLTRSISEAYAFMDFVELQINMNMNMNEYEQEPRWISLQWHAACYEFHRKLARTETGDRQTCNSVSNALTRWVDQ